MRRIVSKAGTAAKKSAQKGYGALKISREKFGQLKTSLKIVGTIATISVLWILSGIIIPSGHKQNTSMLGKQQGYKLELSNGVEYQEYINVSAVTEAEKQVPLKAEIDAKVVAILVREGQFLKAGDPVVQLEVQHRNESLAQTEAAYKRAQIEYKAAMALYDKQLASAVDKAGAVANLKDAESAYKRAQLELQRATVKAPFDGMIDKIAVKVGDYMQALQGPSIIGNFIAKDAVIAVGYVSEKDVGSLNEGVEVQLLRGNGQMALGKLHFISRIANPATRTFRVDVLVPNSPGDPIFSGQTVELKIPTDKVQAHLVQASVTTMDMHGKLGVKIRDKDGIIKTIPVEIVGDEDGKLWLTGLPEKAEIVVLGQNYLQDGEVVSPIGDS